MFAFGFLERLILEREEVDGEGLKGIALNGLRDYSKLRRCTMSEYKILQSKVG